MAGIGTLLLYSLIPRYRISSKTLALPLAPLSGLSS